MAGNVKSRSVPFAIVFSFLTLGIYSVYWFICLTNDLNKMTNIKTAGGVKALLFTILTGGLYMFYWFYMTGKKIESYDKSSSALVHLLLGVFGLGIVSFALAQGSVNRFAKE